MRASRTRAPGLFVALALLVVAGLALSPGSTRAQTIELWATTATGANWEDPDRAEGIATCDPANCDCTRAMVARQVGGGAHQNPLTATFSGFSLAAGYRITRAQYYVLGKYNSNTANDRFEYRVQVLGAGFDTGWFKDATQDHPGNTRCRNRVPDGYRLITDFNNAPSLCDFTMNPGWINTIQVSVRRDGNPDAMWIDAFRVEVDVAPGASSCAALPDSLDFGSSPGGSTLDFTITNSGTLPQSGTITSSNPGEFEVYSGATYSLCPGESHPVSIRFWPDHVGLHSGTISAGGCGSVAVKGIGLPVGACCYANSCETTTEPACVGTYMGDDTDCSVCPDCLFSPLYTLQFGPVVVGSARVLTLSLSNAGGGTMAGTLGLIDDNFLILDDPNYSIAPGENRMFEIEFRPTSSQTFYAQIETDCNDSPYIDLEGSGEDYSCAHCGTDPCTGQPDCSACYGDGNVLDFGEVPIGAFTDKTIPIENQQSGWVSFTAATTCESFSVISGTGFSLGPGQSQSITIRYSATVRDVAVGEVVVVASEVEESRILVLGSSPVFSGVDDPVVPPKLTPGLLSLSPNPFDASTTIRYAVSVSGPVDVGVYDVMGRLVKRLLRQHAAPGEHELTWDGSTRSGGIAATGIYYMVVSTTQGRFVRSTVLLR